MTCAIGDPAGTENVYLKLGSRFEQPIEFYETNGQPWTLEPGTVVELVFGDPLDPIETWTAVIEGHVATFSRTVAQVAAVRNTIRAGTAARVRMIAPPATEPDVKLVGSVIWQ
ncbi:hypothetical protein SEA_KWEKEL_35 [Gordonia phage Kwekel]|uniref:LtfC/p132/Gp6 beta-sandwich domain-containing protein n=1 Tax=Gordonia phage Kwekel TaxID=3077820 RepID=A0AA96KMN0_9CAUD|nr:hypothetical protein SEA_KWEKEL_35 [Gordonia phage Kwekel]